MSLAATAFKPSFVMHSGKTRIPIKAIAFDAFTLFDTRSVTAVAEKIYPGKYSEFMSVWRNRQFEYTWLRCLSNNYEDFWKVTEDALVYTASYFKLELNPENKNRFMQTIMDMRFIPESASVLKQLKEMSLKLAILSNATPAMLEAGINNSGLQGVFDFVISTDRIKSYKPDPAAYQLGIEVFNLKKEEILFVAFGGWDAAGAKTFGYPTVWINAANLPVEQLGTKPDFICKNLTELVTYIRGEN
jgi:2-haloacid dehalogenase